MKCPGCNFVCSELRDLCPRCLIDLRSHKRLAGLPVTKPLASYEELRGTIKSAKPASNGRLKGIFQGVTGRLFAKAEPQLQNEPLKIQVKTPQKEQAPPVPMEPPTASAVSVDSSASARISRWIPSDGSAPPIAADFEAKTKPSESESAPPITVTDDLVRGAAVPSSEAPVFENSLDDMAALLRAADTLGTTEDTTPVTSDSTIATEPASQYDPEPELVSLTVTPVPSLDVETLSPVVPEQPQDGENDLFATHDTSHLDHLIAQALEEELENPEIPPVPPPPSTTDDHEIVFDFVSDDGHESPNDTDSTVESTFENHHATDITSIISSIIDDHVNEAPKPEVLEPAPPVEYHLDIDHHQLDQFTFNDPQFVEPAPVQESTQDEHVVASVEQAPIEDAFFKEEALGIGLIERSEVQNPAIRESDPPVAAAPLNDELPLFSATPENSVLGAEQSSVEDDKAPTPESNDIELSSSFENDLLDFESVAPEDEMSEFDSLDNQSGNLEIFEIPGTAIKADDDAIMRILQQHDEVSSPTEVEYSADEAPEQTRPSLSTAPPIIDEDVPNESAPPETHVRPEAVSVGAELSAVQIDEQSTEGEFRIPTTILMTDEVIPTPNYAIGAAYLWPMEDSKKEITEPENDSPLSETIGESQSTANPVTPQNPPIESGETSVPSEAPAELLEAPRAVGLAAVVPQPTDYAEIGRSFTEARSSLEHSAGVAGINLDGIQVLSERDRQRVLLLFSMAHESFDLSTEKQEYVNELATSEGRAIENTTLVEQLVKIERHIDDAAVVGLRGSGFKLDSRDALSEAYFTMSEAPPAEVAGVGRRVLAFMTDLLLLAVCAAAVVLSFESPEMLESVQNFVVNGDFVLSNEITTFLSMVAAFLPCAILIAGILYSLIRTTPGSWILGLHVSTPSGERPAPIHLFVRTMFLPITVICFGWIPILWGKAPLHDFVARTRTMR